MSLRVVEQVARSTELVFEGLCGDIRVFSVRGLVACLVSRGGVDGSRAVVCTCTALGLEGRVVDAGRGCRRVKNKERVR